MEAVLRDYVIKIHEALTGQDRLEFLQVIKFAPEEAVLQAISEQQQGWGMSAALTSREPIYLDLVNDPREFLTAFREHFAKELAEIQPA